MRAMQHSQQSFESVIKDIHRCIADLSHEVVRLSEEHEREIAALSKSVEALVVEPPKASIAMTLLTSNAEVPCDSLEAEADPLKLPEDPVAGTKARSSPSDRVIKSALRGSMLVSESVGNDAASSHAEADPTQRPEEPVSGTKARSSRSDRAIKSAFRGSMIGNESVGDDAVGGARSSRVDKGSRTKSEITFKRESEISAVSSIVSSDEFQRAGSDEGARSTVQFSHEDEEVEAHGDYEGDDSTPVSGRKSVTFKRWSTRTSLTTSGGDYEEDAIVQVLPVWTDDQDVHSLVRIRTSQADRPSTEESAKLPATFCLDRLVLSPDSLQRLLWDILGMVIIGWDLIFIPLQAFDLKPSGITDFLSWFTTTYWTLDIPTSFLVGYHTKGVVEMRTRKIAPRYLKGWFAFDVSVVSVDWVMSTVQTSENAEVKSSLRFLRMVRLLRLFKVIGFLNELLKRIQSEWLLIILGIVNLLVFIMLMNHMIACAWFLVGQRSDELFGDSWISKNAVVEADVGYQYTTALHWSLTQFTPASMEVVPRNTLERTYNVITLLFAMVTFSSFVSSITNAMTRLRHLNHQWMEEQTQLRQYLQENQISANLTRQVYSFLKKSRRRKGRKIHTQDVVVLNRLSKTLQDSLRSEVYTPILTEHPFFSCFHSVYPEGMQRIYRFAMEESTVSCDQELFRIGELADCIHFVVQGEFRYTLSGASADEVAYSTIVDVGAWLCEQALWIEWRHCGQLVAARPSEVVDVQAKNFQTIVRRELVGVLEPCKYAVLFAEYADDLAKGKKLTDIIQDYETIEEIANEAWAAAMSKQNSLEMLRKNQFKEMGHTMMKSARHALSHVRGKIGIAK